MLTLPLAQHAHIQPSVSLLNRAASLEGTGMEEKTEREADVWHG